MLYAIIGIKSAVYICPREPNYYKKSYDSQNYFKSLMH